MQQKDGFCFCIQFVSPCLSMGDLSPFILRDNNNQWLLFPVNLVFVVGDVNPCAFFPLGFVALISSVVCVFVDIVKFLGWSFPSSTLCVAKYWLNLDLSWNIFFSSSMLIESFAGYSSLGSHPWSIGVHSTFIQDLLAFIVSNEKSSVISNRFAFICYLAFFPCSS